LPPWDLPAWCLPLLFAPIIGSFLGVLIMRLPEGRAVALARSQCDRCGARLTARDMLPLVSYVLLRGKCRHCGGAIGWFHPAVELAAVGVAAWAALVDQDAVYLWIDCLLGWSLLALSWIDLRCLRLPDVLTLPLVLAGLGVTALLQPEAIGDHALAATAGFLVLRGIAWTYRRLRGREGIGAGDAKLLGAAGAWLGLAPLPMVVLSAALAGLGMALLLSLAGHRLRRDSALPFGPCLALGLWLMWLHGRSLMVW
jgi:leader peptidase (prepilin peptidase)/N-methyltransferase